MNGMATRQVSDPIPIECATEDQTVFVCSTIDSLYPVSLYSAPGCSGSYSVYLVPGFCRVITFDGNAQPAIEVVTNESPEITSGSSAASTNTNSQQSTTLHTA